MHLRVRWLVLLAMLVLGAAILSVGAPTPLGASPSLEIVFVARAHLATPDDIFDNEVGPAGQFGTGITKFAPGSKLMVRHANGSLMTVVDGANPSVATGNLIDVQSPDVSFDGSKIVFAGATTADEGLLAYGWRLYEINVDGTGFHKLNIADRTFTSVPRGGAYDFGNQQTYGWWNDLFPAYLADGRIVFASSRYPSRSNYDERHTYNLYIVNSDGSNVHRISTERGGLLSPTPLPDGRILVTRWWNNFNQPSDMGIYNRIDNKPTDQTLADGTVINANPNATFDPATGHLSNGFPIRNAPNTWHLMVMNPDGTDFHRYAFTPYAEWALTEDDGRDTYTAGQPAIVMQGNTQYVAFTSQQDSTMVHTTQKTGIRVARPGATMIYSNTADAIAGLTYEKAWNQRDSSPPYALHPWGVPDGMILFSYAVSPDSNLPTYGTYDDPGGGNRTIPMQGSNLQYQLYTMNLDGSNKTAIPMNIGTADAMDGKPIVARFGWQAMSDTVTAVAQDDPRDWNLPNSMSPYFFTAKSAGQIQTATIHNPNVYANPPLDQPFINNSPMPGSVATAQVYVDANQFTGAYCYGNWPNPCSTFKQDVQLRAVLWMQVAVTSKGEFTATIPADVPSFVVLRDAGGRIVSGWNRGYATIAQGSAWGRPGQVVTCVGCHLGHTSGSLESVMSEAQQGWTNIAPYAAVSASSTYSSTNNPFNVSHLIDRRGWVPVPTGGQGTYADNRNGWMSATGMAQVIGAQASLTWPALFTVSKVRLVGPPLLGGDWGGFGVFSSPAPYHVTSGTLRFYQGGNQIGGNITVGQVEPLANGGTTIILPSPTSISKLTFTVNSIAGKWYWDDVAALQEIEVTGVAGGSIATVLPQKLYLPSIMR